MDEMKLCDEAETYLSNLDQSERKLARLIVAASMSRFANDATILAALCHIKSDPNKVIDAACQCIAAGYRRSVQSGKSFLATQN